MLLGVALLLGTLLNLLSPGRIPWVQDWTDHVEKLASASGLSVVTMEQVREMVGQASHVILDARRPADYDKGHIPTAMSLPISAFEESFDQYVGLLAPETPVLVYCSGRECEESVELGQRLHSMGITNVVLYVGGFSEWSLTEQVE